MIVWVTGQPGHGKSSLGHALAKKLDAPHVDGQAIYKMFAVPNNTYFNRVRNVHEAQEMAKLYHAAGRHVVVSMVSPYRNQREEFKKAGNGAVFEVHVYSADPSRPRKEHHFDGYEEPLENCLRLCTDGKTPEELAQIVLEKAGLT